jgi:hypothetical protein
MTITEQEAIEALAKYSWNGDKITGLHSNTPLTITYSFLTERPLYYSGFYDDEWLRLVRGVTDVNSFNALSDAQRDAFNMAADAWAFVANITFVQTVGQSGHIAITNVNLAKDLAVTTPIHLQNQVDPDGDIFLNSARNAVSINQTLSPSELGYLTILHELVVRQFCFAY